MTTSIEILDDNKPPYVGQNIINKTYTQMHTNLNENIKKIFKNFNSIEIYVNDLPEAGADKHYTDVSYTKALEFIGSNKFKVVIAFFRFNQIKTQWSEYQTNTVLSVFKLIKNNFTNIRGVQQCLEKAIKDLSINEELKNTLLYLSSETYEAGSKLSPLISRLQLFRADLEQLSRFLKATFIEEELKKKIQYSTCIELISKILEASINSVSNTQNIIDKLHSISNRISNLGDTINDLKLIDKNTDSTMANLYLELYNETIDPTEAEIDAFLAKFL